MRLTPISEIGITNADETSLFDGEPRSATVTTVLPTRVIRIEGGELLELIEELPAIAIAICRTLTVLVRSLSRRAGGQEAALPAG